MSADAWWVRAGGQETGPHNAAALRRLVREGKVLPETPVSPDRQRWAAASAVKGLFPDPAGRANAGKPVEVFVSYSSKDKPHADAAVASLEQQKIRCWIAPRDIAAGEEWGEAIIDGIDSSRVMVLIFSGNANDSAQVRREVERAISKGMPLLPYRIEAVAPKGAMEYALGNTHWLDGFSPPVERHLESLARSVRALLGKDEPKAAGGGSGAEVNGPTKRPRWPLLAGVAAVLLLAAVGIGLAVRWPRGESTDAANVPTTAPAPTTPAGKPAVPGFVPLFNGTDLTGWKTHPSQPDGWRVENGVLVGSSPQPAAALDPPLPLPRIFAAHQLPPKVKPRHVEKHSHLYTERGDYTDFHLRAECRINDGGKSAVHGRCGFGPAIPPVNPNFPDGYLAHINVTNTDATKTGGLSASRRMPEVMVKESLVQSNQWFTLELIATGNRILVKVNDKVTARYQDDARVFKRGHIALSQHAPATVCEFRKIEIKE